MKKLMLNELSLRDGNQSLMATRMPLKDILLLAEKLDKVGFNALEVWGGATFDVCLRFLNEDPWERLRAIRKVVKNTKLSMLLRGQNLLGYRHYDDATVDLFVKKAIENGIDIIRVFDALNDINNVKAAVAAIKKYNGHCQIAISYTTSPVHTVDYFVEYVKELKKLGVDSICVKDMSGILSPSDASALISKIKSESDLPICIHSHATSGISLLMLQKSIEAGVDIIDGCISPFSQGASHNSIEIINILSKELGVETNIDLKYLDEAVDLGTSYVNKYIEADLIDAKAFQINPKILEYQVPGGMLTNLISQLKSQGAYDRYEEVLQEIPNVRADLGFPPLVTPLSQMVGTQAVMNVLMNERYKLVSKEVQDYIIGKYGKAPAKMNDEVVELIKSKIQNLDNSTSHSINEIEQARQELMEKGITDINDELILSYILYPQYAIKEKNEIESKLDDKIIEFNVYVR